MRPFCLTAVVTARGRRSRQRHWTGQKAARGPLTDAPPSFCYICGMRRNDVLARLRQHRPELTALGVSKLFLYGSFARDAAGDGSDVDLVVDTPDGTAPGLFQLARISDVLERILQRPVDVISKRGLDHTKMLKRRLSSELLDVF
jgi:predicted nucleotidyltransferase